MKRNRAFTLVEIIVASAILTVIAGTGLALVMTGQKSYVSSSNQMQASTRAGAVMERMLSELRMASIRGEDLDEDDDVADLTGEDLNGNGRIDDDWNLDSGDTASTISFNKVERAGLYSDIVTFAFANGELTRTSGSTSPVTSILATDVTAVTFTRQGPRIIINVVVESGVVAASAEDYDRGGRQVSLIREVLLRN